MHQASRRPASGRGRLAGHCGGRSLATSLLMALGPQRQEEGFSVGWVVLDVAVEQVQKKDGQAVHADFLDHLCAFLQREFEDVVAVPHCIEEGKLEPIQISKMLNVLCEASCNENFSHLIEPKQGLLKATL
ncbi:ataxin-10, partial [Ixodes scapularis]